MLCIDTQINDQIRAATKAERERERESTGG